MYVMRCITGDHQVKPLYMFHEAQAKFEVGNYYKLVGYTSFELANHESAIKVNAKTRIFHCQPFFIPAEIEEQFFHADPVSVEEALQLPPYRRASIKGILTYVSPVKEATGWKRKTLHLSQTSCPNKVVVNLWNHMSSTPVPPMRSMVEVTNVETSLYQGQISFNTTPETNIKEQLATDTKDINITAYCEERFNVTLLSDTDEEFYVPEQMLLDFANIKSLHNFQLPMCAQMTYNMTTKVVQSIKHITDDSEASTSKTTLAVD
ncbi:uncharacterized protein LOC119740349 [Patiria miniata]|uniref:Uncharacterized protein n=1 Tax=Patiria miniata TaxID=46514 RepID=A0A913ZIN1_PATMI|nr:uncharacterized protein LOC119724065 [Patiria miniata]XP_038062443.1 uncharacterized protein LOC119732936 [Patiria miniata]XP_038071544.1 uncharacterized protein LOC119740349 [Patiria miniata]